LKLEWIDHVAELEKNEQWMEMLEFCRETIAKDPKYFFAWQSLGNAHRKLGQPKEAISAYRKGIEVADSLSKTFLPDDTGPLWYCLGHAYNDLGQIDDALAALLRAAEIDPAQWEIWNDLGVIYMSQERRKEAFEVFQKASHINPTNIQPLKNIGIIYALERYQDGMDFVYQKLLEISHEEAEKFLSIAKKITHQN
jgi:tetratricopeptide (TPR) repeat protein